MPDDSFKFVFTKLDAIEALSEFGCRCDLGRAFGYSEQWRAEGGYTTETMRLNGWYLDPLTEYWFPSWWPEWSR